MVLYIDREIVGILIKLKIVLFNNYMQKSWDLIDLRSNC